MTIPDRDDDKNAVGQFLLVILEAVVTTFEHARVDLPARRYVTYGQVAVDCEQVTVSLGQVFSGSPQEDPNTLQRCDGPRSAVTLVQIFRKVPTPTGPRGQGAPSPEDLTASALSFGRDAWLLLDAAGAADAKGWGTGVLAEVSPIDPSGGYSGASMSLTIGIP